MSMILNATFTLSLIFLGAGLALVAFCLVAELTSIKWHKWKAKQRQRRMTNQ